MDEGTELDITPDMLYALEEAASYFLASSNKNFGSGEPDEELDSVRENLYLFLEVIEDARGL